MCSGVVCEGSPYSPEVVDQVFKCAGDYFLFGALITCLLVHISQDKIE